MENTLIEFINTLDLSLKYFQESLDDKSGYSRLTISQFQYIDAIHELGQPTFSEIGRELGITKASVTAGINKLIDLGYVIKTQSNLDKRVFHASLTATGKSLIKAKYKALKQYGEFIAAALTEEEARQFELTLTKLVGLFKQQTRTYTNTPKPD
jgi:DNA-binding MarR family transcriptional regulator